MHSTSIFITAYIQKASQGILEKTFIFMDFQKSESLSWSIPGAIFFAVSSSESQPFFSPETNERLASFDDLPKLADK